MDKFTDSATKITDMPATVSGGWAVVLSDGTYWQELSAPAEGFEGAKIIADDDWLQAKGARVVRLLRARTDSDYSTECHFWWVAETYLTTDQAIKVAAAL